MTAAEKIEAVLNKKNKWTARDAGKFLFARAEMYLSTTGADYPSEGQWQAFYSRRDSELSDSQLKNYSAYESIYLRIMDTAINLLLQKEGLLRGLEHNRDLLGDLITNETICRNLSGSVDTGRDDPIKSIKDVAFLMRNDGMSFDFFRDWRIRPGCAFLYAWDDYYRILAETYSLKNELTFCRVDFGGAGKEITTINRRIAWLSDPGNLSDHGRTAAEKAAYIRDNVMAVELDPLKPTQDRVDTIRDVLETHKWDSDHLYSYTVNMIYYLEGRDCNIE